MTRNELIEMQRETAAVLDAGQRIAAQAAKRPVTGRERGRLCTRLLGVALSKPSEFWAGACVIESRSETEQIEALALSVRLASVQMRAGNLDFVRESLIGQAQWAGVLAVKLAAQAEGEAKPERQEAVIKLALKAQQQAAQALATAAALNKLVDSDAVTVGA